MIRSRFGTMKGSSSLRAMGSVAFLWGPLDVMWDSPATTLLLRSRRCERQRPLVEKRKLRIRLWVGRSRGAKLRAMGLWVGRSRGVKLGQLEAWLEENRKFNMSFRSSVQQVQVVVGRQS